MTKISIFATIKEAWIFLWTNLQKMQSLLIPFVISIAVLTSLSKYFLHESNKEALSYLSSPEKLQQYHMPFNVQLLTFSILLVGMLLRMPPYVALSRRIILAEEESPNFFKHLFNPRELRVLWNLLLAFLTWAASVMAFVICISIALGIIASIISVFIVANSKMLSLFIADNGQMLVLVAIVLIAIMYLGVMGYVWARLSLVLPFAAVDIKKTIRESVKLTKGNAFKIFGINFVTVIFPMLLVLPFSVFTDSYFVSLVIVVLAVFFDLLHVCAIGFVFKKLKTERAPVSQN